MKSKSLKKLAKFISNVLGRTPDAYGLVPDDQGFVSIKELIKAFNEEEGWRHIRRANLNELALTITPSPIEIRNNKVRACQRSRLPEKSVSVALPKLLYTAVRTRAYLTVLEKGLKAGEADHLILCGDAALAERIGRRRDHHPILLTVQVSRALDAGTRFYQYGEQLYLADVLFPNTFSGPAPPKERPAAAGEPPSPSPPKIKTPGSYFPDLSAPKKQKHRKKEADWKKDRRRARKHKARQQE